MKKILAMIVAAALSMSMCVTAFADGSQTVTVTIPGGSAVSADYTMTIPADTTIEYGNTDYQNIGAISVKLTNPDDVAVAWINVAISWDGELTNTNGSKLAYSLNGNDEWSFDSVVDYSGNSHTIQFYFFANATYSVYEAQTSDHLRMKVASWDGAEKGTDYSTTLTYTSSADIR